MEDQEEEKHQHRSDERKRNLWAYGPVHIVQSAELHTHPFRQVQLFQELLHGTGGCGLALAETHIRTDYDDRLAVHAGEGFRFPLGTELSHLTQRYRNSRYGRGHKGIGYVFVIRPIAVILRIEIYRNYGFTLPDAAQREGPHLAGQGKIHQGTVHAHTQSLILVKFHRNGRYLIVRVGVHPFKHIKASHIIPYGIRNLTHLLVIFPENLHFHRSGHSLVVHLLEMYHSFGKPVLVARLHFLEKRLCGLVGSGVHYELSDIRSGENGRIGSVETRSSCAYELSNGGDSAVLTQKSGHRVGYCGGVRKVCRRVQIDFHGKDRTGSHRHKL